MIDRRAVFAELLHDSANRGAVFLNRGDAVAPIRGCFGVGRARIGVGATILNDYYVYVEEEFANQATAPAPATGPQLTFAYADFNWFRPGIRFRVGQFKPSIGLDNTMLGTVGAATALALGTEAVAHGLQSRMGVEQVFHLQPGSMSIGVLIRRQILHTGTVLRLLNDGLQMLPVFLHARFCQGFQPCPANAMSNAITKKFKTTLDVVTSGTAASSATATIMGASAFTSAPRTSRSGETTRPE